MSIDEEDPTAVSLLGVIERRKLKAGLGVSQGAIFNKEIHQKLLQRQPAGVRSRHSAAKTCLEAVCAQGGSSCATQPEAQPLEGLQQAVEGPISVPETSETQKVRRPAAHVTDHFSCPPAKRRAQGSVAAALQMCLFMLLAEVFDLPCRWQASQLVPRQHQIRQRSQATST